MIAPYFTIVCLAILALIRVQLGHHRDMQRIDELYAANMEALDRWKGHGECPLLHDYREASRGLEWSTILNPLVWTYRQYYPKEVE